MTSASRTAWRILPLAVLSMTLLAPTEVRAQVGCPNNWAWCMDGGVWPTEHYLEFEYGGGWDCTGTCHWGQFRSWGCATRHWSCEFVRKTVDDVRNLIEKGDIDQLRSVLTGEGQVAAFDAGSATIKVRGCKEEMTVHLKVPRNIVAALLEDS